MARLLLVKAEYLAVGVGGYPVPPPLGLLSIASFVRERRPGRDEIRMFDLRRPDRNLHGLGDEVRSFGPDVVGISALTIEADSMEAAAACVKRVAPGAIVVVGGPHATAYQKRCARDPHVDFVVIGEGEESFAELLDLLETRDRPFAAVEGIAFREGDDVRITPSRDFIQDLDRLPMPAWDLHDFPAYTRLRPMTPVYFGSRSASLFTSRACPYRCIYCHGVFGKKFRAHSPKRVVDEMEMLHRDHGVRDFEIIDDIFNFDQPRVHEICDLILARGLDIRMGFPNGLRGDRLSDETLEKMARAGTVMISLAFESTSKRLQKLMKKNMLFDRIQHALDTADRLGIYTQGLFMLGFPTETREELEHTVAYAARSRLTTALFSIVTPFEGTEMMQYVPEERREEIPSGANGYFLRELGEGQTNLSTLPDRELYRIHRRAFRRFYGSPRRLLKIMKMWPGSRARLALAGLRTLRYVTIGR